MIAGTSHSRESKLSGIESVLARLTPLAISSVTTWSHARISAFKSILENLCSSTIPGSSGFRSSLPARSMTWSWVSSDSEHSICSVKVSSGSDGSSLVGDSEFLPIEGSVGSKKSGP
jgi:hypothetical protein